MAIFEKVEYVVKGWCMCATKAGDILLYVTRARRRLLQSSNTGRVVMCGSLSGGRVVTISSRSINFRCRPRVHTSKIPTRRPVIYALSSRALTRIILFGRAMRRIWPSGLVWIDRLMDCNTCISQGRSPQPRYIPADPAIPSVSARIIATFYDEWEK